MDRQVITLTSCRAFFSGLWCLLGGFSCGRGLGGFSCGRGLGSLSCGRFYLFFILVIYSLQALDKFDGAPLAA
ncbi:MAG: hypothetical protein AB2L14_12065 [Candidatus Xenobiia bacterium LiM19]